MSAPSPVISMQTPQREFATAKLLIFFDIHKKICTFMQIYCICGAWETIYLYPHQMVVLALYLLLSGEDSQKRVRKR